jgi:hypothetical protein
MGKRKHRDPAEREAREARRAERADRSIQRKVNEIAAAEYAARLHHELNMAGIADEDLVSLEAEGFVGKHVHVIGTPEHWPTVNTYDNPVTPLDENGSHDPTTSTG